MMGTNLRIVALAFATGCSASSPSNHTDDGGNPPGGDGNHNGADAGAVSDGDTTVGGPMSCPGPGTPSSNGGSCGSERWNIKTGTDSQASSIQMVAVPNTIAALAALPANGGGSSRTSPTETTIYELKNVTLTEIKSESDSDYHMVISDGTHTMITEIPYMGCAIGSAWTCYISQARSTIDAKYTVSGSPQYPSATVTVRGVGFFDYAHGQTGVAPNAIELHPVLQVCFGKDCTP